MFSTVLTLVWYINSFYRINKIDFSFPINQMINIYKRFEPSTMFIYIFILTFDCWKRSWLTEILYRNNIIIFLNLFLPSTNSLNLIFFWSVYFGSSLSEIEIWTDCLGSSIFFGDQVSLITAYRQKNRCTCRNFKII